MATYMKPCVPLPIDAKVLEDVSEKAKDWALMHGVAMRSKQNFSKDSVTFAPFLLLPSTFPRPEFERAVNIQTVLNTLVHRVAHDFEFLRSSLSNTIKVDDFTGRLFSIYEKVLEEGITQGISLGLLRSDYFIDVPQFAVKQVEINTVATSLAGVSTVLVDCHRFTLTELGHRDKLKNLPENGALAGLSNGMLKAWEIYDRPTAAILFLVEDVTFNICDQRFHEFEIQKLNPDVRTIRKTLTEVAFQGTLDSEKRLFIDGVEIALVYFRSGYSPDQYHTNTEWNARLLMERSRAIKCPSIYYHLAGTKKIQQELARPGVLEKFLDDPADVCAVRRIFTGLYSLDQGEAGDKSIEMAIENPRKYVLKPQREGGGNNVYDEEIKDQLEKIRNTPERDAWILMEKIQPPLQKNYMIRPALSEPLYTDFVSELGIYGVIIGDAETIIENKYVGHMLRTKVSSANEGGVAAGWGALDSVYLVDPCELLE
ncbi:unnamed protein product [Allacma fusca]|uniref:Glutathione synthetase n=1 Tax=Allacma fusca TaxID=39272 RepID=A0A8J2JAL8_9HEXA|nr:unnamed protein product [Allacma fusca]